MFDRKAQIENEALVLACRTGNRAAFQELARRWQEPLWRHALRLTGHQEAAWDVLQETWMDVAQGIMRLRDPTTFRAWVYRVATRRAMDWHRSRHGQPSDLEDIEPSENAPEPTDAEDAVRQALARLSGTQRVVMSLHYLEGCDVAEVAEILGIAPGTVKSRLHHAREKLRAILERTKA